MSGGSTSQPPNYYAILQLPKVHPPQELVKEDVKAAYHRALLLHHPDKAGNSKSTDARPQVEKNGVYSVDSIIAAYETLADPLKRNAYDASFEMRWEIVEEKGTHPGVETFDLEDLSLDEDTSTWHQPCRCGSEDGFVLTEAELEKVSRQGEIYVGCKGCSLFIKVVFGVAEEEVVV